MEIIDVHLHFFENFNAENGPMRQQIKRMMEENNVVMAIAMGSGRPQYQENPPRVIPPLLPHMDAPLDLAQYNFLPNTAYCAGIKRPVRRQPQGHPGGFCKSPIHAPLRWT